MENKEKDLVGEGINPQATGNVADILKTHAERLNNYNPRIKNVETNKQDTLVSGTNIKTINGQSILGNGDIVIDAVSTWIAVTYTVSADGSNQYVTLDTDLSLYSTIRLVGNGKSSDNNIWYVDHLCFNYKDIQNFRSWTETSGSSLQQININISSNRLELPIQQKRTYWQDTIKVYVTNITE